MTPRFTITLYEPDGTLWSQVVEAGPCLVGRDPQTCQVVVGAEDVSRRHVRLCLEEAGFLVEDMGSHAGTTVDGVMLEAPEFFAYPQTLQLGRLRMDVEIDEGVAITCRAQPVAGQRVAQIGVADRATQRLALLYELPLQFAREENPKRLCALILESVMRLIGGAARGALLILEPASGKLALHAGIPEDDPPISRTLIRRAALGGEGFVWEMGEAADVSQSILKHRIKTGMYAPMIWHGQVYGVISVDHPAQSRAFQPDDLDFLMAVANYAASAVASQLLRAEIEDNNRTLQNLLTNFSPRLRTKLLEQSRRGQLQPGGEKSEVTILMSDFRGFTRASEQMDPEFVVQMLNDYFSVLADIVFLHDGTIDKFIGDAILAVFGSPEADSEQAVKASRCGLAMQAAMAEINHRRQRQGLIFCGLGIGIHTGEVLHGFIGGAQRLEYTVIGDTVNKAARYCDGAGVGEVVISPTTLGALGSSAGGRPSTIPTKHEGDLEVFVLESLAT